MKFLKAWLSGSTRRAMFLTPVRKRWFVVGCVLYLGLIVGAIILQLPLWAIYSFAAASIAGDAVVGYWLLGCPLPEEGK